jgi:hypothetical protein
LGFVPPTVWKSRGEDVWDRTWGVSKFLRKDEVWDLLPAVTVECVGKDLDSESYEELSDWLSYDICWEEIGEGAFENSPK